MYFDKKNINALTYLVVFFVLIVILFYAYRTYINYKTSHTLYSNTDNVSETLLIDDWKSGFSSSIKPTNLMPQSMIPTEYSISFLIYLNNIDYKNRLDEQLIFIKGQENNSELTSSILPLGENSHISLRFTCKLKIDVDCTPLDALLNNVCTGAADTVGGFIDTANIDTNNFGDGEQFSNTSFNSNRIHDKIGSNVVDYFTVQNIYSNETFASISKETFQADGGGADGGGGGGGADGGDNNQNKINEENAEIDKMMVDIETLLGKMEDIVSEGEKGKAASIKSDLDNEVTVIDEQINKDDIDTDRKIELLRDKKAKVNTANEEIKNLLNEMSGLTKNEDYVELQIISTQKIAHICLVMRDNIIDVYKNGLLEVSKVLDGIPLINDGKFNIFPNTSKSFNGLINKFTYFNKALNHDEVESNYKKHVKELNRTTPF